MFFEKNLSSNFVKFERAKYEKIIVKIITDIIRNFEKYNTFLLCYFFGSMELTKLCMPVALTTSTFTLSEIFTSTFSLSIILSQLCQVYRQM